MSNPSSSNFPEPVDDLSDASSLYTQNLRDSILSAIKGSGRPYHKYFDQSDHDYIIPIDGAEQERLEMQHEIFLHTFGGALTLAPLPRRLQHALDIGTGTGIWAIDFADEHPECRVVGTDIARIQPAYIPPNCSFETANLDEPWGFEQKFDYIHGRALNSCYTDGKRLIQRAYDALKPGGWLELQDISLPLNSDDDTLKETAWERWAELFTQAMETLGRDTTAPMKYKQWINEVGFENVVERRFKWPQNPWPKDPALRELGKWGLVNTLDALNGYSIRPFTQILGMKPKEVQVLLGACRMDIKNPKVHAYWPVLVVYGQKPGGPDTSSLAVCHST